jgi:hypothetical protein
MMSKKPRQFAWWSAIAEAVNESLLKGWLVDGWTPVEAKLAAGQHPRAQAIGWVFWPRRVQSF